LTGLKTIINNILLKQIDSVRNKHGIVEKINSRSNRFRNLFTRYEKKVEENYLSLVILPCSTII